MNSVYDKHFVVVICVMSLAVIDVELDRAIIDAGRQYLHGAPKGGVVDGRLLALLVVDDVVHVGILLGDHTYMTSAVGGR